MEIYFLYYLCIVCCYISIMMLFVDVKKNNNVRYVIF